MNMELCEQNEACVEEVGELTFSQTNVIPREGNQYCYAITDANLTKLPNIPTPFWQIWLSFPLNFTRPRTVASKLLFQKSKLNALR
jgi:hypothetical protein